jgi:hypothetical protein
LKVGGRRATGGGRRAPGDCGADGRFPPAESLDGDAASHPECEARFAAVERDGERAHRRERLDAGAAERPSSRGSRRSSDADGGDRRTSHLSANLSRRQI